MLGDRLPCEFLKHLKVLCSDLTPLYEVTLLDALPDAARTAAILQSTPEEILPLRLSMLLKTSGLPQPMSRLPRSTLVASKQLLCGTFALSIRDMARKLSVALLRLGSSSSTSGNSKAWGRQ